MFFTMTPEGACDYTSKSFQEYIGATPEEARCSGWIKSLHRDDLEPAKERWQHSIRTGELLRMEYRFLRYDGQYRWFLGEAHPVLDEAGRIVKWVGALTDIHQEKQARELLETTVADHREYHFWPRNFCTGLKRTRLSWVAIQEGHLSAMQAPRTARCSLRV
jgi:PAS domain S-box-containing protein